jgi:hypothetical protein
VIGMRNHPSSMQLAKTRLPSAKRRASALAANWSREVAPSQLDKFDVVTQPPTKEIS